MLDQWQLGPEAQIESTVENLRELSQDKLGEASDIETKLDELNGEVGGRRD